MRPSLDCVDTLICLDPGLANLGISVWEKDVVRGWVLLGSMARNSTRSVEDASMWALEFADKMAGENAALVSEYPTLYPRKRGTWGTCYQLRQVVANVEELYPWLFVHRVQPREWKGSTPKKKHHQILQSLLTDWDIHRAWESLTADEKDSIGIGLWATGRLKLKREA